MECSRSVWLALALGPCPTVQALLAVREPLAELEASWAHRLAFAGWPAARGVGELLRSLRRHLDRLQRRGANALLAHDSDYPAELRSWPRAPAILFCWGELAPGARPVALVGSRAAGATALQASRALGKDLARAGCCVVSGGAIGVDGAAHEGARSAGGRTVAILGSGLDHLYPQRHLDLFGRIVAAGGTVLSPFSPWTPPRRWQFPRRNEVIARLSRAVVVVEAATNSAR